MNRGVRRIFESKRDEVTGEWRNLYSEKLSDRYISPNIFRASKLRRFWWGLLKERGHLVDPDFYERVILF